MNIVFKSIVALIFACAPSVAAADIYATVGNDGVLLLSNHALGTGAVRIIAELDPACCVMVVADEQSGKHTLMFNEDIKSASAATGLDADLIHAVIAVESSYVRTALSARGAAGLMQLMPSTALRFGITDVFDARQNISAGARFLQHLMNKYGNRLDLALAAYNAGEGAVERYGERVPPYRETLVYIDRVRSRLSTLKNEKQLSHELKVDIKIRSRNNARTHLLIMKGNGGRP